MEKISVRVACGQINSTVGDLRNNAEKILFYVEEARKLGVDIISFPELSITGYPPEDLLMKDSFLKDNIKTLNAIARKIGDIITIIGFVDRKDSKIFNAAAIVHNKKIKAIYHKKLLPNYGVFDEMRYFTPGDESPVYRVKTEHSGYIFAVSICEDIWQNNGPVPEQSRNRASIIININASPYHMEKIKLREKIVTGCAKRNNVYIVYTNLVGGQDELVFDGQSFVASPCGNVISSADAFKEKLLITDVDIEKYNFNTETDFTLRKREKKNIPVCLSKKLPLEKEVYGALILGLRDYVEKNGFGKIVIGLSGGIDSALVATIAVDALGKDRVICVFMPSRYTSLQSKKDVKLLTKNLGVHLLMIPIEKIFSTYLKTLAPIFKNTKPNITEENIQARIRGNLLMALSNKFGYLVLTTGNKSEISTGYATLYGDMAGGFAVIKDVPKTLVYKLAKHRNRCGNVIPESILEKEPTAELRPDQKDTDSLPPYETLDSILKLYVEQDKSIDEMVRAGFERKLVEMVVKMVDRSEYKRRQSPPGIKITPRSFGKDRRMPITNKYHG
ncbi:MAG: NAD+ synthase [Candidatus Omnitrophica bacterium]|nr:NAD+ synthase [Candidatus Omnitrophota bacterium]MCM8829342.1 NAD+ synthase [Candidatus Omnitrophota bacterium]